MANHFHLVDFQELNVAINQGAIKTIQAFAAKAYPHEACGFIVKKGKRSVAIRVANE